MSDYFEIADGLSVRKSQILQVRIAEDEVCGETKYNVVLTIKIGDSVKDQVVIEKVDKKTANGKYNYIIACLEEDNMPGCAAYMINLDQVGAVIPDPYNGALFVVLNGSKKLCVLEAYLYEDPEDILRACTKDLCFALKYNENCDTYWSPGEFLERYNKNKKMEKKESKRKKS